MRGDVLTKDEVQKLSQYKIKYDYLQVDGEGGGDFFLNYDGLTSDEVAQVNAISSLRDSILDYAEKKTFAEKPRMTFEEFLYNSDFYRLVSVQDDLKIYENTNFSFHYTREHFKRRSVVEKLRSKKSVQEAFESKKEEERKEYEGEYFAGRRFKGLIEYAEEAKAKMYEEVDKANKILGQKETEKVLDVFEETFEAQAEKYEKIKKDDEKTKQEWLEEEIQEGKYSLLEDHEQAKQLGISEVEVVKKDLVQTEEYDLYGQVCQNQLPVLKMAKERVSSRQAEKGRKTMENSK